MEVFYCLQGEEFQGVVQVMREFLPQAEAELKFKSLPDDEMAIIQMIEKHEVKICTILVLSFRTNRSGQTV